MKKLPSPPRCPASPSAPGDPVAQIGLICRKDARHKHDQFGRAAGRAKDLRLDLAITHPPPGRGESRPSAEHAAVGTGRRIVNLSDTRVDQSYGADRAALRRREHRDVRRGPAIAIILESDQPDRLGVPDGAKTGNDQLVASLSDDPAFWDDHRPHAVGAGLHRLGREDARRPDEGVLRLWREREIPEARAVAFETAKRLSALDRRVDGLILIEVRRRPSDQGEAEANRERAMLPRWRP